MGHTKFYRLCCSVQKTKGKKSGKLLLQNLNLIFMPIDAFRPGTFVLNMAKHEKG